VIVLSAPGAGLALAVDQVRRIVPLEDDAVMPCESEEDAQAFIRGVFDHQGRMINLLDTDRLLASLRQDANL
jgi:purine-binding chemotaxis protein CheW